ncbi:hypothetical protein pdam_00008955, partial [Pocillopora damicornis]
RGELSTVEANDSSGGNYQGQGRGLTTSRLNEITRFHQSGLQQDSTEVDLLAELGNDFNSGDQPEELSSDKGATKEPLKLLRKVGMRQMSHLLTIVSLKWQLLRCEHMQTNMTRTHKTSFLTESMNILSQLRFLDSGGQFAPIFAWISKVRLR